MRQIALALLLASSAGGQPDVPATPAGRVFAAWLAAFNSGDLAQVREFDRTWRREGGPPVPPPEATLDFRAQTGGFALLRIEKHEPTTLVALLPWRGTAAGGGYSTAGDLLRFAGTLEAGTLVSKTILAEATSEGRDGYGHGFTTRGTGATNSGASQAPANPAPAQAPIARSTQARPGPAQPPPGTDIWLARLTANGLEQPINITNRPGYDNQPSFTPDGKGILFTRSDGTQTDIYLYDFTSRGSDATRVTDTPESEYSPTITPDGAGISVIRVEADGTQRLWRFTRDGQSPTLVLRGVKPVGYHAWGPDGQLALFVLGLPGAEGRPPNPSTLQVADVRTGRARIVAHRIGRSLHRIPGRSTISVLHNEGDVRTIKELDLKTRRLTPIVRALESSDGDYTWTPDGAILMSNGKTLMRTQGGEWSPAADLAALGLAGASRIAVSPDGRWLALVTPDTPRPH